jgi:hypothetical protein
VSDPDNFSKVGKSMLDKGVPAAALKYLLDRGHTRESIAAAGFRFMDDSYDIAMLYRPSYECGSDSRFSDLMRGDSEVKTGEYYARQAIVLPYPDDPTYAVTRFEYATVEGDDSVDPPKFLTPTGRGLLPYIPKSVSRKDLLDPKKPLYIIESPFKAAAAAAHGLLCIGVNGHTGVFEPKTERTKLRPELRPYMKPGRESCFLTDADVRTNSDVCKSQLCFLDVSAKLGCKPVFIEIPDLGDGKTGIDDWFKAGGTLKKFEKLDRHARESQTVIELRSRHTDGDGPTNYLLGPDKSLPTREELLGEPHKAPMIVEGYLQQDAGGVVGSGETGKSTVMIFEAVHIILGRPLYGKRIMRTGGVLYLTAEDDRAMMMGRLNDICRALKLSEKEQNKVLKHFHVEDISATPAKLVESSKYGVHRTTFVDEIVEKYKDAKLAMVVLDPTSLLGPGELSGNDGMAELMRTARMLRQRLNAAVRVVHHVSQNVARGGIWDQYAGRGGTAFADNSRSQHQIVRLTARKFEHEESEYTLPAAVPDTALAGDSGTRVLAIFTHKLSYSVRDSVPVILIRRGFAFEHVPIERIDKSPPAAAARRADEMERVVKFIAEKCVAGLRVGKKDLESYATELNMSRDDLRDRRNTAMSLGLIVEKPLPAKDRRTNRTKYLAPFEPNPADPAESGGTRRKGSGNRHGPDAANPAADGTSTPAAGLKPTKRAHHHGTKKANPAESGGKPRLRKRRLNGQGAARAQ